MWCKNKLVINVFGEGQREWLEAHALQFNSILPVEWQADKDMGAVDEAAWGCRADLAKWEAVKASRLLCAEGFAKFDTVGGKPPVRVLDAFARMFPGTFMTLLYFDDEAWTIGRVEFSDGLSVELLENSGEVAPRRKPMSPERLQALRRQAVEDLEAYREGLPFTGTFTCDDCAKAGVCEFVYDPYNTNGDCLALK